MYTQVWHWIGMSKSDNGYAVFIYSLDVYSGHLPAHLRPEVMAVFSLEKGWFACWLATETFDYWGDILGFLLLKLSFHINIKDHSDWHCATLGQGKCSKNMSLFDFEELQLKSVIYTWYNFEYIFLLITFKKRVRNILGTK